MNQPTFAISSTPLQPQTARPVAPVVYGTQPVMTTPAYVTVSPSVQPVNPFQPVFSGYGGQYGVQPTINPFTTASAPTNQTNPFLQV